MLIIRSDIFQKERLRGLPKVKVGIWKFVKEWNDCHDDIKRDTSLLFKWLQPEIDNWVEMLTNPNANKNISYGVLWSLVDYGDPYEIIPAWVEDNFEDLRDIIFDVFLNLLRNPPFTISVRPKQYMYVLGRLFIYKLGHRISSWYGKQKYENVDLNNFYTNTYTDTNINLINAMIDIEASSPYWYYLCNLYLAGYEHDDFLRVTKTTSSYECWRRKINEWKD